VLKLISLIAFMPDALVRPRVRLATARPGCRRFWLARAVPRTSWGRGWAPSSLISNCLRADKVDSRGLTRGRNVYTRRDTFGFVDTGNVEAPTLEEVPPDHEWGRR